MKNGRLIGNDTHSELLENCPEYADMVAANERRDRWTVKFGGKERTA